MRSPAAKFVASELPLLLGLEGLTLVNALAALGTILDDGEVFAELTPPVPSAEDTSRTAAIPAVRAEGCTDGTTWDDASAIGHAFFLAADALMRSRWCRKLDSRKASDSPREPTGVIRSGSPGANCLRLCELGTDLIHQGRN